MAEVILAERTLSGFTASGSGYMCAMSGQLAPFVENEEYTIVWDGTEYVCVASVIDSITVVGNQYFESTDNADTGEPFLFAYVPEEICGTEGGQSAIFTSDTGESHTVAIYQGELEEESPGISIVLYDRTGEPVTYEGVETITTDTPDAEKGATFTYGVAVENAEYKPNFAEGNQKVTLEKGQLLKEFTLVKPETLLPEYIKKNVEVAGVLGEFAGDETEKTVDLAMTNGDQVIEADKDTVMTKVTVKKPATMLAENIKKDVEIGGVIGVFVGDGIEKIVSLSMTNGDQVVEADKNTVLNKITILKPATLVPANIVKDVEIGGVVGVFEGSGSSSGDYKVTVIDYDGTVIAEQYCNEGDVFTLPDAPTHERLVFDGWSSPIGIIDNTVTVKDYDIAIGATYYTASGATEIDVKLTTYHGLTITFNDVLTGCTSIDWGDGTTDNSLTHTYANYGEYTIKIYGITDISSSSYKTGLLSTGDKSNLQVLRVFLSNSMKTIGKYAFYQFKSMLYIVFPSSIKSIGSSAMSYCESLKFLIFPLNLTSISSEITYMCYSTKIIVLPYTVTEISESAFKNNYGLTHIVIPDGVTTIDNRTFYGDYNLEKITLPSTLTALGSEVFSTNYRLSDIAYPASLKSIGSSVFSNCANIKVHDFSKLTSVPTLGSVINSSKYTSMKIKVPTALYDEWVTTANWSTDADCIVAV
ncbi:MAG: leucine-rich repeat domain-containing protein [Lachnospiraceae bacterium]|nr:leucine-rich repeat domain-containing protein [Lachnospiraceae bacterium]